MKEPLEIFSSGFIVDKIPDKTPLLLRAFQPWKVNHPNPSCPGAMIRTQNNHSVISTAGEISSDW
ncbi:hypothetical protein I5M27_17915 [Adhaeribacter sp. BT258]|uniref:Uncharacterized protein n=1 Tax=Adhaeribacter terrigena TaxID=2793070 RepID=A0ABS1C6D6_9BACT|nr:hypothetical protein [Adhaeribacter terrigena]MBK0404873.1 hypothetical protein [Adhaeribacter terrigena]